MIRTGKIRVSTPKWEVTEPTPEEIAERAAINTMMEKRRIEAEEARRLAVPRKIEALRQEAAQKLTEADRLEAVFKDFPDLRIYTGRWNKEAFCSKSVNTQVTDYEMRHNCGCCSDSPMEVWPYMNTPHGRVYSEPSMFFVGRRNPDTYGDRADTGWDEKLRLEGIPETLIERIGYHFEKEAEPENDGESPVESEEEAT